MLHHTCDPIQMELQGMSFSAIRFLDSHLLSKCSLCFCEHIRKELIWLTKLRRDNRKKT